MLHKFLNDFLALAPLQLPELINQERMEHQSMKTAMSCLTSSWKSLVLSKR